ncbi:entericidin A/B family lipoprotein [Rhodoferax bucti]|nr:entericidin A/B family lipoprotein [Rhodoferax bucti]
MKTTLIAACAAALLLLSACNTVKGMGQDLQKAGEKIEGAAKK